MAVDTLEKRASIIALSLYSMGPSVQVDGTIDTEDRQIIGYSYSGIAAATSTPLLDRVFHIIEPFDLKGSYSGVDGPGPVVRPVQVRPFDVLNFAWGWVKWTSFKLAFAS